MTTKWHKGPPPEIGWWPASIEENDQTIRWWDGKHWSAGTDLHDAKSKLSDVMNSRSGYPNSSIMWAERWW